jgi:hypothetical protein
VTGVTRTLIIERNLNGSSPMYSRRHVILGLALLAMSARGASAAEESAQDFLARIYATYKGKDAKGVDLNRRGATARYFSPSLARLIDADVKAAKGEVGQLGSDPFIDAQDFEIAAFVIDVKETAPGKALGTVKFKLFTADETGRTITLDLVKLKSGWRIDEIRGPTTKSLRALFKKR